MFQKRNRYFADWYAKDGSRKRRSFTTAKEARIFEQKQKAKVTRSPQRHGRSAK